MSALEDKVAKIQTWIEEVQPRLQDVVNPCKISFKEAVARAMTASPAPPRQQPENRLADAMTKNGQHLGAESLFGQALVDYGEALTQMAEAKTFMEDRAGMGYMICVEAFLIRLKLIN